MSETIKVSDTVLVMRFEAGGPHVSRPMLDLLGKSFIVKFIHESGLVYDDVEWKYDPSWLKVVPAIGTKVKQGTIDDYRDGWAIVGGTTYAVESLEPLPRRVRWTKYDASRECGDFNLSPYTQMICDFGEVLKSDNGFSTVKFRTGTTIRIPDEWLTNA